VGDERERETGKERDIEDTHTPYWPGPLREGGGGERVRERERETEDTHTHHVHGVRVSPMCACVAMHFPCLHSLSLSLSLSHTHTHSLSHTHTHSLSLSGRAHDSNGVHGGCVSPMDFFLRLPRRHQGHDVLQAAQGFFFNFPPPFY
jgi:hypothetical protein